MENAKHNCQLKIDQFTCCLFASAMSSRTSEMLTSFSALSAGVSSLHAFVSSSLGSLFLTAIRLLQPICIRMKQKNLKQKTFVSWLWWWIMDNLSICCNTTLNAEIMHCNKQELLTMSATSLHHSFSPIFVGCEWKASSFFCVCLSREQVKCCYLSIYLAKNAYLS